MSVIFHTNAGAPVLAGDMLLSVLGPKGTTDLRLPSQPNGIVIPCDRTPRYIPVRMRRKIFVVNDRMAVGAAGSVPHIKRFIDDLIGKFRNRSEFTYAEIRDFLRQYASKSSSQPVLADIGAVILAEATDWRGSLTSGLASKENIISDRFGRVIAIGTGSDSIVKHVQRFDKNYKYGFSQPTDGNTAFPEFRTLASNLMLLGNLYWSEFAAPDKIFDAWGGAYDLIYQNASKAFQYLDEYTIFLRLYDLDQADKGIQLGNVLKYERRSDISFIAMMNSGKLDFFGAKDITAPDRPSAFRVGGPDFKMNSNVHVSIIAVGKGGKFGSPIIQIDGLDPAERAKQTVFTKFDQEGRLWVAFDAETRRMAHEGGHGLLST